MVIVILFYSAYLPYRPIIDTIVSEKYLQTNHSFGWYRSFASFGFAAMGIVYAFLPGRTANSFFIYVCIMAFLSAAAAKMIVAEPVLKENEGHTETKTINKSFVLFLIYTVLVYICASGSQTFFPVYYTSTDGLGGRMENYGVMISIGTFIEWGIMMVFGKVLSEAKPVYPFLIISLAGALKELIVYLAPNTYCSAFSMIFHGIWYGTLWSVSTPYMKKILPENSLCFGQGVWTVASTGLGTFLGSMIFGSVVSNLGLKNLFAVMAIMYLIIAAATPILFCVHRGKEKNER